MLELLSWKTISILHYSYQDTWISNAQQTLRRSWKLPPRWPAHRELRNNKVISGKKKLCCFGNVLTVRILQVLNPHSLLLPSINITKLLSNYIMAILIIILFKSKHIWAPTKLILIRKVKRGRSKRRLALRHHMGLGFRWPSLSPHSCSRSLAILFQLLPKATHAGIVS